MIETTILLGCIVMIQCYQTYKLYNIEKKIDEFEILEEDPTIEDEYDFEIEF